MFVVLNFKSFIGEQQDKIGLLCMYTHLCCRYCLSRPCLLGKTFLTGSGLPDLTFPALLPQINAVILFRRGFNTVQMTPTTICTHKKKMFNNKALFYTLQYNEKNISFTLWFSYGQTWSRTGNECSKCDSINFFQFSNLAVLAVLLSLVKVLINVCHLTDGFQLN